MGGGRSCYVTPDLGFHECHILLRLCDEHTLQLHIEHTLLHIEHTLLLHIEYTLLNNERNACAGGYYMAPGAICDS